MPTLDELAKRTKPFKKREYRSYSPDKGINEEENTESVKPEANENDQYKIIKISTDLCAPWAYADRGIPEMGNIEELAQSIKINGQQEPALVRKIKDSQKYEIIFGHRRWLACKCAHVPLLAMVKELTDKEAAIAQKEENENRENLSDYSKALNYKTLLDNDIFKNESELAIQLNIKRSTLSDIMCFTKLPDKLLSNIEKPHELPKRLAVKLSSISNKASEMEIDRLCELLPLIIQGKIPFSKLSLDLIKDENHDSLAKTSINKSKTFKNSKSVKLFSSGRNQNKSFCFNFHKIVEENNLLEELEHLVFNYLKDKTE